MLIYFQVAKVAKKRKPQFGILSFLQIPVTKQESNESITVSHAACFY
jgi:hypothetical protein